MAPGTESNKLIHTMLSGHNTYNRQLPLVSLRRVSPCCCSDGQPLSTISITRASDSATVQSAISRCHTFGTFNTAETPAEALNSLQFAYPNINDEEGRPWVYGFYFLLNAALDSFRFFVLEFRFCLSCLFIKNVTYSRCVFFLIA